MYRGAPSPRAAELGPAKQKPRIHLGHSAGPPSILKTTRPVPHWIIPRPVETHGYCAGTPRYFHLSPARPGFQAQASRQLHQADGEGKRGRETKIRLGQVAGQKQIAGKRQCLSRNLPGCQIRRRVESAVFFHLSVFSCRIARAPFDSAQMLNRIFTSAVCLVRGIAPHTFFICLLFKLFFQFRNLSQPGDPSDQQVEDGIHLIEVGNRNE
jgi:hypothetical protein